VCVQFVQRYISTIGVDFGVKPVTVSGKEVKVNFWDLSGHPDFFEVRNEFYKDAQGVCIVCAPVCRRASVQCCCGRAS
jgi:DnaJ family protein C protein 27